MKFLGWLLCLLSVSFIAIYESTSTIRIYSSLLLVWTLLTLAWIDFHYYLLPDRLTLPLLWSGLLVNAFGVFVEPSQAILGACGGYVCLASAGWLFKLLRGKQGMGQGDYKFLAALGAWFGGFALLKVMVIATSVGSITGIGLVLFRRQAWQKPLPFGVFLSIAAFIELLLVNK